MAEIKRPLIFGEVLFDHFPDGSEVLGGAPFNVAWNLRGLGLDPLLLTRVGRDEAGDRILAAMEGFGLDTSLVQRDPAHPTGLVQVEIVDGEPGFEVVEDCAWDFIERPVTGIDTPLVYHGSLALRNEVSAGTMAWILQESGDATPVFFDVNLRSPWWDDARIRNQFMTASFIKLNATELDLLVPGGRSVEDRARSLFDVGTVRNVFLTRGADGATGFARESGAVHVTGGDSAGVVDTVGAGDAFSSVLILGLLEDWPRQLTLDRAHAFATAVVGLRGATSTDPGFYSRFRSTWSAA